MTMIHDNFDANEQDQKIRELGEKLKSIREAQGLSVNVISDITKIQKRYLQAIEAGELSELPAGPYVRGFIRQYCEFLSATDLWNAYDALTRNLRARAEPETLQGATDYIASPKIFRATSHLWIYLIVIASLTVAAWITWSYRGEITGISTSPLNGGTAAVNRYERETPSSGVAISEGQSGSVDVSWMDGLPAEDRPDTEEPSLSPDSAGEISPARAAAPEQTEKNALRIEATASVWLNITSGEQSLYRGTLKTGEVKTFKVTNKAVRVRYGNPGGAAVTWNNSTVKPLRVSSKPLTITYYPDGKITEN